MTSGRGVATSSRARRRIVTTGTPVSFDDVVRRVVGRRADARSRRGCRRSAPAARDRCGSPAAAPTRCRRRAPSAARAARPATRRPCARSRPPAFDVHEAPAARAGSAAEPSEAALRPDAREPVLDQRRAERQHVAGVLDVEDRIRVGARQAAQPRTKTVGGRQRRPREARAGGAPEPRPRVGLGAALRGRDHDDAVGRCRRRASRDRRRARRRPSTAAAPSAAVRRARSGAPGRRGDRDRSTTRSPPAPFAHSRPRAIGQSGFPSILTGTSSTRRTRRPQPDGHSRQTEVAHVSTPRSRHAGRAFVGAREPAAAGFAERDAGDGGAAVGEKITPRWTVAHR